MRRSLGHDRVNCRLGTRTVDAFQLLQRLLSRFLVSYRPLAIFEAAAANRAATTRWEKSNDTRGCVLGPANTRGSQSDIAAALREDAAPSR